MAAKLKLMKFLLEARALADMAAQRPVPRSPMLHLIQLRPYVHEIIIPKRRIAITSEVDADSQTPQPVKINFPQPAGAACRTPWRIKSRFWR